MTENRRELKLKRVTIGDFNTESSLARNVIVQKKKLKSHSKYKSRQKVPDGQGFVINGICEPLNIRESDADKIVDIVLGRTAESEVDDCVFDSLLRMVHDSLTEEQRSYYAWLYTCWSRPEQHFQANFTKKNILIMKMLSYYGYIDERVIRKILFDKWGKEGKGLYTRSELLNYNPVTEFRKSMLKIHVSDMVVKKNCEEIKNDKSLDWGKYLFGGKKTHLIYVNGVGLKRAVNHQRGVDIFYGCHMVLVNKGTLFVQYQHSESKRVGSYFAPPEADPEGLGIDTGGRNVFFFVTTDKVPAAYSVAGPVCMKIKGRLFKSFGGMPQFFMPRQ